MSISGSEVAAKVEEQFAGHMRAERNCFWGGRKLRLATIAIWLILPVISAVVPLLGALSAYGVSAILFVFSAISTGLILFEKQEPWTRESGWHYVYCTELLRLKHDLQSGTDPIEIDKRLIELRERMGRSFPHWQLAITTPPDRQELVDTAGIARATDG